MNVLILHNRYQHSGGEDAVFAAESALLRENGHTVIENLENNQRISSMGKMSVVSQTLWSRASYNKIRDVIIRAHPDIAHFHNTFPLISPSAYYACHAEGIPVVQTLHNYRLLCPVATLYRDNAICEECLGKTIPWPGIYHGCYHRSRAQTAVVTSMLGFHRLAGTWRNQVDLYIALTEFARQKFIQGGLPVEKIVVKPNFVYPDPGIKTQRGDFALFVGRLSPEKGINTLVLAWNNEGRVPLKIVGDGPMKDKVDQLAQTNSGVEFLGTLERSNLIMLMKEARFLILPSECYEGLPMTIIEAFACQLPVIAPDLGSSGELVADHFSGLLFNPGDPIDLAAKVKWAWEHPLELAEMGRNARREYEEKYTADRNYGMLMEIYQKALKSNRERLRE
jgi:glycosyltransferase involved in cell wall biosynthesis